MLMPNMNTENVCLYLYYFSNLEGVNGSCTRLLFIVRTIRNTQIQSLHRVQSFSM
jgi:hypothetical protein